MLRNQHLVKGKSVHTAVKKKDNYSLCGDLLRIILARDGWTLHAVNAPLSFAPTLFLSPGRRSVELFFSSVINSSAIDGGIQEDSTTGPERVQTSRRPDRADNG